MNITRRVRHVAVRNQNLHQMDGNLQTTAGDHPNHQTTTDGSRHNRQTTMDGKTQLMAGDLQTTVGYPNNRQTTMDGDHHNRQTMDGYPNNHQTTMDGDLQTTAGYLNNRQTTMAGDLRNRRQTTAGYLNNHQTTTDGNHQPVDGTLLKTTHLINHRISLHQDFHQAILRFTQTHHQTTIVHPNLKGLVIIIHPAIPQILSTLLQTSKVEITASPRLSGFTLHTILLVLHSLTIQAQDQFPQALSIPTPHSTTVEVSSATSFLVYCPSEGKEDGTTLVTTTVT